MGLDPLTMMAAASVGSSLFGAKSASDAAGAQADAANQATALTRDQFDKLQQNLGPFIGLGRSVGGPLSNFLGIGAPTDQGTYGQLTKSFTSDDFRKFQDPGYQFQLNQGQQALQNSQAAGDGVLSGAALKGLIGFNQGMANTAYNSAFDRFNTSNTNTYNRLAGLLQLGETAAAGQGAVGANLAGTASNSIMGAGNAAAAGKIGVANAIGGGVNNGMGYYMLGQMMNPGGGGLGIDPSGFLGGPATAGDYSDIRLKTEVRKIGTREDGLNEYEFRYVWGGPVHVGLMAHEVKELYPEAVSSDELGFLMVDYSKVQ